MIVAEQNWDCGKTALCLYRVIVIASMCAIEMVDMCAFAFEKGRAKYLNIYCYNNILRNGLFSNLFPFAENNIGT